MQIKILRNEADAILRIINSFRGNVSKIIFLGDIKEPIGFPRKVFREQIKYFFKKIESAFEDIIVVRGNHDGRLADIFNEYHIEGQILDAYLVNVEGKKVLLTHGHMKPPKDLFFDADVILIGHVHPANTEIGEKLWVAVKFWLNIPEHSLIQEKSLVIFPAANPKLIGVDIDEHGVIDLIKRICPITSDVILRIDFGMKLTSRFEIMEIFG